MTRWDLINLDHHGLSIAVAQHGNYGATLVASCRCGWVSTRRTASQAKTIQGSYRLHLDKEQDTVRQEQEEAPF